MINAAAGITVLDGMATLAGVRPARAAPGQPVTPVEPVRRSLEDRVDLSDGARAALSDQLRRAPAGTGRTGSGIGRLIDVLA